MQTSHSRQAAGAKVLRPAQGQRVLSISGRVLGTVSRTSGPCFRIEDEAGKAMWLGQAALFTVDSFATTLVCERDGLERYRVATQSEGLRI